MTTLNQIQTPIKGELARFKVHFSKVMKSKVPLLDIVLRYIVRNKGKQIRPTLVFLAARLFGATNERTYNAAALVELLHTATLVHDDVVDEADQRRGFFSINAVWKNKIAVLAGDYLMSKGLLLALDNDQFQLLKALSVAVRDMSEGELLQLDKARKLDITEEEYFDIINGKTASLLAASCRAGAQSVTDHVENHDAMWAFGQKLGMAFQIKDDLLDYGEGTGKPKWGDLKEKKLTLPLIYALSQSSRKERRRMIGKVKQKRKRRSDMEELMEFIRQKGGMEYAKNKMLIFKKEAMEILNTFPNSDIRASLVHLLDFVVERTA